LIAVLGDQLSPRIASLRLADKSRDVVLMAEVASETHYVSHHKKKIAFILSAMRHFAGELAADGWRVDYVRLVDTENSGALASEIARAARRHSCASVIVTEPGEWRVLDTLGSLPEQHGLAVEILDDDRFICTRNAFADWADGRKQMRMEHFYREMRRKTGLLMDGDKPVGGKWNFDAENRKPPKSGMSFPGPLRSDPDAVTQDVLALVEEHFADHFGTLEPFWFAVTRDGAEAAFDRFVDVALPRFGDYQDAMLRDEKYLYHAVVSLYLNVGLLDPLDVCRRVERAYRDGHAPLNAAEGFIRQVIGWREYVRGIYWLQGPEYVDENVFGHTRPLPDFFWTGSTEMACVRASVEQTRDEAYAHHIQRLMVTGNFAMLAGVDPRAVHEWYLAVYADAFEWVELPNTLGMSQFADGGLLASKPYAASGNYINRMSDYCTGCRHKVHEKTGAEACPFNYLYWDFLARHRDTLGNNPRLAQPYRTLDGFDDARRRNARDDARNFLHELDRSATGRAA
jgi:deoxyribodipyrimidine photolyase-related protein